MDKIMIKTIQEIGHKINQTKKNHNFCKKNILILLGITAFPVMAQTNIIKNGGFEEPLKKWWGGAFNKGPGKLEQVKTTPQSGKYCMRLFKERKPGGTQLMTSIAFAKAGKIEFCFYHRGDTAFCMLTFLHKENGKMVYTKNAIGKVVSKFIRIPSSVAWRKQKKIIAIPKEFIKDGTRITIQFQLSGGKQARELFIDDVGLKRLKSAPAAQKKPPILLKYDVQAPPKLTDHVFSLLPKLFDIKYKNGLMYRNGKPYFWVGNGCDLGSAQATPVGLWLAKLQKASCLALESSTNFFGRRDGDTIRIQGRYSQGGHSWYREAVRLGFLIDIISPSDYFKWSPLKKLSIANPDFAEICYNCGHGMSIDSGYPTGLAMCTLKRGMHLQYQQELGNNTILELGREPGPSPSNQRIRQVFRDYAKNKYKTLKTANKVWRKNYKTWQEVIPPHLDTSGMFKTDSQSNALRVYASENFEEMYYDWLRCVQLDIAGIAKGEADDIRKHYPGIPITIDVPGIRMYTDQYCLYDPALIDQFVDLFFIHLAYPAYEFKNVPADLKTLNNSTTPLFIYNYFKSNSRHPIWNCEDAVVNTRFPDSAYVEMVKNDIGQLHNSPWQFSLDDKHEGFKKKWFAPDFDDSNWSRMTVPGCWDKTKEFAGKTGWGWYRKTFIAKNAVHQEYIDGTRRFYLYGRGVAQKGTVWLNGHKLGEVSGWKKRYCFDIGPYLKFGGKNQITFYVQGDGYDVGLRFYCHILRDDMMGNQLTPFGEKQYRAMLWTFLMRGSSAVSVWHRLRDDIRPYLAKLVNEINSVSAIVLPELRKNQGGVVYLYSYLYGKGLPTSISKNQDHMNYYNALEMSGIRPDIFGEEKFLTVIPDKYKLAVIPYARIVHPETYSHFKKYVASGGTAIVTFGSLEKTFERYQQTDIATLAGIKLNGKNNNATFMGIPIHEGDETQSTGVKITLNGAKCLIKYPDGTPAVTENQYGKGRIIFIAPRLEMPTIQNILKSYLPVPEIKISSLKKDKPLVERILAGDSKRKLLYLFNRSGLRHDLSVTIPEKYADFTMQNIVGKFKRISGNVFHVSIESQAPAALLLENKSVKPYKLAVISPKRKAIIKRVVELNKEGNGVCPKVLFPKKPTGATGWAPVGKELYPYLLQRIKDSGYEIHSRKPTKWTAEYLKQFKLVVINESWSNSYYECINNQKPKSKFKKNIVDYVKNGGSLMIMCHTGKTVNSSAVMLNMLTPAFGISMKRTMAYDTKHCGFGDPMQIVTDNLAKSPLTEGVKTVQLYTLMPLVVSKTSSLMPLVFITKTAEKCSDAPVMVYGKFGKGKVFISSDIMTFQPFRIEYADNAALLVNIMGYLLDKKVTPAIRKNFKRNLFITEKVFKKIKKDEKR